VYKRQSIDSLQISAEEIPDTHLLRIMVVAPEKTLARDITNLSIDVIKTKDAGLLAITASRKESAVYKERLRSLDLKLRNTRIELAAIDSNEQAKSKNLNIKVKMEALKDEIDAMQATRTMYSDMIDRIEAANLTKKNSVETMYPARLPLNYYKPNLAQNIIIAIILSTVLFIVIGLLMMISSGASENSNEFDLQISKSQLKKNKTS
jgi:hypothetical protein